MNSAIIALGSNIDPTSHMTQAIEFLGELGTVIDQSPLIWTKPQGYADQDRFLNGAAKIQTALNQTELVAALKRIEKQLKRIKTANKAGPRTIDLDLIMFNEQVLDSSYSDHAYLRLPVQAVLSQGGQPLTEIQRSDAELCFSLTGLSSWSLDEDSIERVWKFKNFDTALRFINQVGELAESLNHHPDLRLYGYKFVEVRLSSHDKKRVTSRDIKLALAIAQLPILVG
jgi:2-amino-4-hydroxy-6-hydroxymethyldihydropteridine diphosphokinase